MSISAFETNVFVNCPYDDHFRPLVTIIPGFQGAHTQGETLDELQQNLQEVIKMLLDDGKPVLDD